MTDVSQSGERGQQIQKACEAHLNEIREEVMEQVYQQGEANYVKAKKVPKFVEFPESHTALDGYHRRIGEPLE